LAARAVSWSVGRLPAGHNCLRKLYARSDNRQEKIQDPLPSVLPPLKIAIRLNFKHKTPNCTIKKFVAHH